MHKHAPSRHPSGVGHSYNGYLEPASNPRTTYPQVSYRSVRAHVVRECTIPSIARSLSSGPRLKKAFSALSRQRDRIVSSNIITLTRNGFLLMDTCSSHQSVQKIRMCAQSYPARFLPPESAVELGHRAYKPKYSSI